MDWTSLLIPACVGSFFWAWTLTEKRFARERRRRSRRRVVEGIRFQCLAIGRCRFYAGGGN
jgi:hypothetical protein